MCSWKKSQIGRNHVGLFSEEISTGGEGLGEYLICIAFDEFPTDGLSCE